MSESMFSVVKTNSYFVIFDIVVKTNKQTNQMWFSVVCTLISTTILVITVAKMLWTHEAQPGESATNWATSQSARFALVIEYVTSIHPWANSRCWISQSERTLWFSYVINICNLHIACKMWNVTFRTFFDNSLFIAPRLRYWQTRTHCCGHIAANTNFSPFARASNICCGHKFCVRDTKMFLILFRNILCLQKMFPSLCAQGNVMSSNVSATMFPRLPPPLES